MAKIAVELDRALARRAAAGIPGHTSARILVRGEGWSVADVVCTCGPGDRPFEERHSGVSIAVVLAGTFQYRSAAGRELMTPGSLLLGNTGQCFECGHEHGTGDRCLSFGYSADYFDRLAADAGMHGPRRDFRALRLPPLRVLAPLVAQVCSGLTGNSDVPWGELGVAVGAQAVQLASGVAPGRCDTPPGADARVTRTVRLIDRHPDANLTLERLAGEARLSPYHFLRTFERLTGLTPHQYVLRARLREAATRLASEPARILDIALDCGFGDVSNFNRAFRTEFGLGPRRYRLQSLSRR